MRLFLLTISLVFSLTSWTQNDSIAKKKEGFIDYSGIQLKMGIGQMKFSGNGYSNYDKFASNKLAYEFSYTYDISPRSVLETGIRTSMVKQNLFYPNLGSDSAFVLSRNYTSSFSEIPLSISLKLFRIKKYSSVSLLTGYSFGWIYSDSSLPEGFQYAKLNNLHSLHLGARASIKLIDRLYFNLDVRRTEVVSDLNQSSFTSKLHLRHLLLGLGYKFGQCD